MNQNHYTRTGKYSDGDWTVPGICSAERIQYPFEGNTKAILLNQDYMVFADYYLETTPAIGSAHPTYAGMYFVKDSPPQEVGGGIVKFTRTYAMLPGFVRDAQGNTTEVRVEPESYVWTKPGVNTINQGQTEWLIDNSAVSYPDSDTVKLYTQTNPATGQRWVHDVTSPSYNRTTIFYQISTVTGIQEYTPTIVARGTNWVQVAKVPYDTTATGAKITYIGFSRPQVALRPLQKVVPSTIKYDYWLPGVNCVTIDDIPLEQPLTVYDPDGNETDTLTETTNPNVIDFNTMVTAGTEVLVERPIIRRWQGPIFERSRRYITLI